MSLEKLWEKFYGKVSCQNKKKPSIIDPEKFKSGLAKTRKGPVRFRIEFTEDGFAHKKQRFI